MLRTLVSILVGAAVAFGLFVIMAKLIENTNRPAEEAPPAPVIDIVMDTPDEDVNTRNRKPPPKPQPPKQPPKMKPTEPEQADPNTEGFSLAIPGVDTGGVGINIGSVGAMRDGEATPVVRIEPKYPVQAARDGIQGWVQLRFTINEVGGVEDIEIINAEPRRVFDREAKRALRKWKYKPKVVDGKPQRQPGMTVQLDFTLEQ